METLKIDISKVFGFVPREEIYKLESRVKDAAKALENKSGKGNDFLGWVQLSLLASADPTLEPALYLKPFLILSCI
jgi:glucose-6-phosphate isomerase